MKKSIFLPIILSVAIIALGGCFTDKSSLDTNKLKDMVIETPSMPTILRVEYLQEVTFDPTVKFGNATNPTTDVKYRWQINQTPGSTDLVEIGTERVLKTTIKNMILSAAYTLIFTAIDEKHGVEYQRAWPLFVSSSFREGIVVADTRDGASSDLSLIMDNDITTSYTAGLNVKYNIWKTTTGSTHPALIKNLTYTLHKPSALLTKNVITAIFENKDIKMYDCQNYSVYKTAEKIFPGISSSFEPQAFYTINNSSWVLVANNKSYVIYNNQGHTSFMLPASGVNYSDNAILAADNSGGSGPYALWFDNNTGKFHAITMTFTTPATSGEYTTQGVFNPNNLPGRRMVATDVSVDGYTPGFLLKNTTTNNYELYTISFAYYDANWNSIPSAPKLRVDLPAELTPILNSAVSVFFAMFDPIMYIATPSKIYAVKFGGGVVSYSEKYTAPAGEQITKAKLFVQGRYRLHRKDFDVLNGPIFEAPLALNTKAVVVSTSKGQYEGFVYVLPYGTPGTGDLNSAQAKKYSGFGKILDFTIQGQ
ncbi:MAG: PKD-like family lipoprotein [Bacteroidales bacterium]